MKRRGGPSVDMNRTVERRRCPKCMRDMRLARCPDDGVDTVDIATARKPLALAR